MAMRPIDLQQVVVKSVDVARETVQQQQLAAAAQDTLVAQQHKRSQLKTETVQQFEEAGAAAIHERGARSGDSWQEPDPEEPADPQEDSVPQQQFNAKNGLPRPRVGRHVDVQA